MDHGKHSEAMIPIRNISSAVELGQLIRQTRQVSGLTQQDLADVAETGRRFIIELEAGKATSQIGKVFSVLACLGLHVSVGGSNA